MKILVTLILFVVSACSSVNKPQPFTDSLAYKNNSSVISVPVRIHLLKSNISRDITAVASSEELEEMFNVVNLIWKQAGIKYEIESITYLNAYKDEQYVEAMSKTSNLTRQQKIGAMNKVCNITKQSDRVLNLCVIGKTVNGLGGIYFGGRHPKVIWPTIAKNGREVLNPATLAHEFGHYLGLKHNSEEAIYLMRGRGNNMRRNGQYEYILFTEREITSSRKVAMKLFE
ncbi:hypothetical protein RS130_16405 [Paraglaciecola aquimarina]|uniref:Peptidase M10 metallopeptidase domain-containing protein n=1 Tax=Paraglaciecola aquimarina TaxID=1235557 RepID=A0ABU3SZ73_9ALTE|nr:hypothetical protein [Paraglaciecola aquimarina]MDU0355277.1 hypothetical protein [Paraglaciecola aquimarina]